MPFYRQRYDFTCGPASLMMAMKFVDKRLELSKELEMDIWREANMLESYGTSRYGLAFSAVRRGFGAKIYSNIRRAGFVKKIEPMIGKVDYHLLKFFLDERKMRSAKLGAREGDLVKITGDLLKRTLKSGSVPIVLSNTEYFNAEDIPHWIAISGIDKDYVYVNNPLGRVANRRVPLRSLDRIIGFKGDQCMVAVSRGGATSNQRIARSPKNVRYVYMDDLTLENN
jgi:predicted double-glycine peptidase